MSCAWRRAGAAVLSGFVLVVPLAAGPPAAAAPLPAADGRGWIEEDLGRAEAVGAQPAGGGLRAAREPAPGASL
ncbi:hypothetical protein ACFPZ0_23330, partial [Streptomonospora nanhaiensis]